MRTNIIAIAALAGALALPLAARAQSETTMGVARSGQAVIVSDGDPNGIAVDARPAFREYVTRERVPTYTVQESIVVGTTLPDVGVTYYDVPQSVASTPYRYTVVNNKTVLVEPRSRKIVQVID